MAEWIHVCNLDEIPVLGSRRVNRIKGPPVAVFRTTDDQVYALLDRCPHKGGPLSQGIVFGKAVACPLHNWTIALDTGTAREPDEGCTPRFAVKLEQGQVMLQVAELASIAINVEPIKAGPCTRSC